MYESGRYIKCNCTSCFNSRDIGHLFYGRCFEIEIENEMESVSYITVDIKKPVLMYINLPHVFYNGVPRSKFQANIAESLQLEATYEILQTHFNDDCKTYSRTYDQSFDACKLEVFDTNINCSLPFMFNSNRREVICQNVPLAYRSYWKHHWNILPECPISCVNMITSFGVPVIEKREDEKGTVFILFTNLVKVTEDFISYDLLRFKTLYF